MTVRFYVWESDQHGKGDGFWKSLCVVFDNEAFGLLERILTAAGITYKATKE